MLSQSDLSQVSLHFLHLCLRGFWDPPSLEAAVDLLANQPLDWSDLQRIAIQEKLAPLLYWVLRGKDAVPQSVEAKLQEAYYRTAWRNSLLLHELESILSALADQGVAVLLLKGGALAETAYGSAALRPMVDVDLLVPQGQVEKAERTLGKLHYESTTSDPWPGFSWRYRNAMAFGRSADGQFTVYVGLHKQLYDVPYYEHIPVSDWFARASSAPGALSPALLPTPEDHLVYLCGHLALHHQYNPSLLNLVDIALLVERSAEALNWGQVVRRTVDWRLVLPVQHTLERLERLWPGTIPQAAALDVARLEPCHTERRVYDRVVSRPRTPASNTLLTLATMPGLARRIRFLIEVAVPSPAYMRQRYCPQRPHLWPLAYLQRAGRGLRYLVRRAQDHTGVGGAGELDA